MRLHILSDLHLEFGKVKIPETDADVVVLMEDIHVGSKGMASGRESNFPTSPSHMFWAIMSFTDIHCQASRGLQSRKLPAARFICWKMALRKLAALHF